MASLQKRRAVLALGAASVLGLCVSPAARSQQAWPSRPIQLIVPGSAGSGTDVLARSLAERLSAALKQPIIVDNRPGASGAIAINAVVKAPNDGYTLLYSNASFTVVAPAVLKSVPYDVTRDLVPIAQTAAGGVLLLVNKDVSAQNLQDLIDLVKANPQQYGSYGSWAIGSSGHLMMEWLKAQTGMKITHVAYRSVPQLLTELSSGVVKVAWADPSSPLPFIRTGKIRCIAVSDDVRLSKTPDAKTLAEQGHPFNTVGWFGLFAPAGTSPAIIQRLYAEVSKIQASPEIAKLMASLNFESPPTKTQAQFRDIVQNDLVTWRKIATEADIKINN